MTRLFAWIAWGEWRAHPLRNALSVLAIALGVALGFAVHLINAMALDGFTSGMNRLRGAADLQVRGTTPAGFDETLFERLADRDGPWSMIASSIAVASPVVEREVVAIEDPSISIRIVGLDPLRAVAVTPRLIGRPSADDRDAARTDTWFDPDAIWISSSLRDALHKKVGDRLAIGVDGATVILRIAGFVDEDEQASSPSLGASSNHRTIATMDIAGAQWRLGRLGRLSRIDLRLREGVDGARVRDAIARVLPPDARITDASDDSARTGDLSRAYRVNLDMLALMALFTGAFLVYSTQSLAVARRRAQLALLRVVGVVRRHVIAQVLAEGAVQGVIGGLLGLVLGLAFAVAALRWFGGDLGGGYFARTAPDLHRLLLASPLSAATFFALGVLAALIGSFFPAREAARAQPAVALKSAGSDNDARPASPWLGTGLLAAGIACAFAPPIAGLPILGYVAMALLLFGGIAAMPWFARVLLAPFAATSERRAISIDLALHRLRAAPGAAAVALCGIVASASLMVAMTVMIASFRHSVDAWLVDLLSADLYVRTNSVDGGGLGPADVDTLRAVSGVASIEVQKVLPISLASDRPAISLIARGIDADPRRSLPLVRSADATDDTSIPIWVSEAMVELYGFEPGRIVSLPLGDPENGTRYRVAGVWRDYARQFGSIAMRRVDYSRITGDTRFSDAAIRLSPGASATVVGNHLRDALPATLQRRAEFAEPATIRAVSLAIFDRSFAVTYLLQAVAIAIGLAGVAATFSAQTLARAKEFGMLRHVGVLKSQIAGELATEGALLGVVGCIAGGSLGLAIGAVLIHVVNPQSFHWTMDTVVPWSTLATVGFALVAVSAIAALVSGRRAMAHDAVLAVREDW